MRPRLQQLLAALDGADVMFFGGLGLVAFAGGYNGLVAVGVMLVFYVRPLKGWWTP